MHEINNKIAYLVEFCTGSVDEKSLFKCPFHLVLFHTEFVWYPTLLIVLL